MQTPYVFDPNILLLGLMGLGFLCFLLLLLMIWREFGERRKQGQSAAGLNQTIELELSEMKGRLSAIADIAEGRQAEMAGRLNDRLDQVGERLGANLSQSNHHMTKQLSELQQRLAVIDNAQRNITDLSSQMVTLRDILANKQSRGAFGQMRMEAILEDALPKTMYSLQPTLSNNKRPDALIHLPGSTPDFVIDAKFPLEGFEAFRQSQNELEKKAAASQIRTDISRHLSEIAARYFITGETQDTALMFVPAESLYAELHENFEDLIQKSHRTRIVIVSPNMLMLAVQTMFAIMKDAEMRKQAGLIQHEVIKLHEDIERLSDRVEVMKKHHDMMGKDLDLVTTSARKISSRREKIENLDLSKDEEALTSEKSQPQGHLTQKAS